MDIAEVEESLFAASDAKLHGGMCTKLSAIVCKVLGIFPELEAARPRSKSGIQALCSLHVALEKAKSLLQHCSNCSKLYLAITGDSVLLKFEKAKASLEESLRRVEDIVPQAIGCKLLEVVGELEQTKFSLDRSEKQVGDEVITLLQQQKNFEINSNDNNELEVFHQAATRLGITSSRAALAERRALKRLIERARLEEDKRKESIVAYLLHLMRKYSKLFRSEVPDDNDSQGGSTPCSPTVQSSFEESGGNTESERAFERQFSKVSSFNFKINGRSSGNMPVPPEELRCPISLQLMYDPVIISSGQTYERICIEKWFKDGHSTCPKTQQQLSHLCLTPNYCVRGLIASWCEHNGIPIPDAPPDSLDLNYWRLALSESEAVNLISIENFEACNLKENKAVPLEDSGNGEKLVEGRTTTFLESCQEGNNGGEDEFERYERLLAVLCEGKNMKKDRRVVEQIRYLLKDDEEARYYMGANGFVDALVQFLRLAVHNDDVKAQEVGAMALFNLAVNNNRNKEKIVSSGVFPLLEAMILRSNAYESATALYLNLSCLDEAKSIIGSSRAVSVLVRLLQPDTETQCRLDALHTLYNLSTYPSNIPRLLYSGIISGLQSLLTGPAEHSWSEKSIAILINLAMSKSGKKEIITTPGLISVLASILDSDELLEQEQSVSCLLILCDGDEKCSQIVLQEGVIPALVSISVNGTARGKDRAQKLLMLFREQRQRDPSPARMLQRTESSSAVPESKPLCKPTRKVGRSLTSMWKSKNFSVYQC